MAPRETKNNAYAKFWGDKQRTLWYVTVISGVVNWHCHTKHSTEYCFSGLMIVPLPWVFKSTLTRNVLCNLNTHAICNYGAVLYCSVLLCLSWFGNKSLPVFVTCTHSPKASFSYSLRSMSIPLVGVHPPFIAMTQNFPKETTKTLNKKPINSFPSSLSYVLKWAW